jgi:hypothetical protein
VLESVRAGMTNLSRYFSARCKKQSVAAYYQYPNALSIVFGMDVNEHSIAIEPFNLL